MPKFLWTVLLSFFLATHLMACSSAAGANDASSSVSAAKTPSAPQSAPGTPTALVAQPAAPQVSNVYLGEVVNPPVKLRDFRFPASTGQTLSLSDMNGKWRVVFFGYLHCPDFCPLTLSDYRKVKRFLGEDAANVLFVYISVDGDRDTPEVMANFLKNYDAEFIGLQGNDVDLMAIQPDYGFYYRRNMSSGTSANYTIDHSTRSYLIDPQGNLVASFLYSTAPATIAQAIQAHMRQWEGRVG